MATLFFSLYFIILVVIYMFQDRISKKFICFMIFKLPFFLFLLMFIAGAISIFNIDFGPSICNHNRSCFCGEPGVRIDYLNINR